MPKRSLHPGNDGKKLGGQNKLDAMRVEQLNKAVDVMLARVDGQLVKGRVVKEKPAKGKLGKAEVGIESLVRIAAELRNLPRESFKARLKSEL